MALSQYQLAITWTKYVLIEQKIYMHESKNMPAFTTLEVGFKPFTFMMHDALIVAHHIYFGAFHGHLALHAMMLHISCHVPMATFEAFGHTTTLDTRIATSNSS